MSNDEYLFTPVNGKSRKPISREMAWIILNKAARELGIKEIGTHTLRKTFGYHFYQKTKDVALLQYLFNHSYACRLDLLVNLNLLSQILLLQQRLEYMIRP